MDKLDHKIRKALISQWDEFRTYVGRINPSAVSISPTDGFAVIKHVGSTAQVCNFDFAPVLFVLPERAGTTSSDLHVIIRGKLAIDRGHFAAEEKVRTSSFATEAGYFRLRSPSEFIHVLGAHYDFSVNALGHPVFHIHVKSFAEFGEFLKAHYGMEDINIDDAMHSVLRSVRLPSAQMDAFSLFLQLVADHLVGKNSSDDEKSLFLELLNSNKSLQGAGCSVNRLQQPAATTCYRAVHWYSDQT